MTVCTFLPKTIDMWLPVNGATSHKTWTSTLLQECQTSYKSSARGPQLPCPGQDSHQVLPPEPSNLLSRLFTIWSTPLSEWLPYSCLSPSRNVHTAAFPTLHSSTCLSIYASRCHKVHSRTQLLASHWLLQLHLLSVPCSYSIGHQSDSEPYCCSVEPI
jgi:hypothetical protein